MHLHVDFTKLFYCNYYYYYYFFAFFLYINICISCKKTHDISLDTTHHNVVRYKYKYSFGYQEDVCASQPDQIYKMYCERCNLPTYLLCKEHKVNEDM